jgi:hypothetical protein
MTWTVHTKGNAGERSFEIAVVRQELIDMAATLKDKRRPQDINSQSEANDWSSAWNAHATLGYGWFGRDKLLISHNGGPCSWPVTQQVWDKLIRVAQEVADELNADGIGMGLNGPSDRS